MDKRRQGYEAFIAQLKKQWEETEAFQGERLNRMIAKVQAYLEAAGDLTQDELAKVIAADIAPGSFVNLGIGQPTTVSNYLEAEKNVTLHTENGMLGFGPEAEGEQVDEDLVAHRRRRRQPVAEGLVRPAQHLAGQLHPPLVALPLVGLERGEALGGLTRGDRVDAHRASERSVRCRVTEKTRTHEPQTHAPRGSSTGRRSSSAQKGQW